MQQGAVHLSLPRISMDFGDVRFSIRLSFEEVELPPFRDILVLGKNAPHGKIAITKILELLLPDSIEVIDIDDPKVSAIFISRKILLKMPREQIIAILKGKVFPFVSEGEILRVDVKISGSLIT